MVPRTTLEWHARQSPTQDCPETSTWERPCLVHTCYEYYHCHCQRCPHWRYRCSWWPSRAGSQAQREDVAWLLNCQSPNSHHILPQLMAWTHHQDDNYLQKLHLQNKTKYKISRWKILYIYYEKVNDMIQTLDTILTIEWFIIVVSKFSPYSLATSWEAVSSR